VEGEVWVPVYDGLYTSTNSGKTFTKLSTFQNVVSVTLGKAAPGSPYATIFVQASLNGTWAYYRSTDHGAAWVRINDDAHQYGYAGSSFIVADQGTYGRMYISTHCMGIAYGEITTPTGIVDRTRESATAKLQAAPLLRIGNNLTSRSALTLHDLSGRLVRHGTGSTTSGFELSLEALPIGSYLARSQEGSMTVSVIR